MPDKAEACYVGHRMHAGETGEGPAGRIELCRRGDHRCVAGRRQEAFLQRRAVEADAQAFAENQLVAGAGTRVALEVVRMHQTDGDESVDRFDRIDGMAAGNRNAGLRADRLAAVKNSFDGFER